MIKMKNMNSFSFMLICFLVLLISCSAYFISNNIFISLYALPPVDDISSYNSSSGISVDDCNCIVFRMDDIQDYWLNSIQTKIMDLFLLKNQSLSLGIISAETGDDSKLINKINEGVKAGLFELASHGWKHIEYPNLDEQEQKETISKSIEKINELFKQNTSIFLPPYLLFNNSTLNAMTDLGLKILSSGVSEEVYELKKFDQFFAKKNEKDMLLSNSTEIKNNITNTIFHLPATVFFHDYENEGWVKIPVNEIIAASINNIQKYGYAIIGIHPQDFAIHDSPTDYTDDTVRNVVNESEISDLSRLVDKILSQDIKITGFQKIVDKYERLN